jgi:hypothetical protein
MAVGIANTGTFGFADTVAVVEDDLANDLVLKGKYEAEHSEEEIIPHFPIEFGRKFGSEGAFLVLFVWNLDSKQLVTFL